MFLHLDNEDIGLQGYAGLLKSFGTYVKGPFSHVNGLYFSCFIPENRCVFFL